METRLCYSKSPYIHTTVPNTEMAMVGMCEVGVTSCSNQNVTLDS